MPELNQLEYCYLVEDTDPEAMERKIFIPKLMGAMGSPSNKKSKKSVNTDALMNSDDSDTEVDSSVSTQGYILAPVQDSYQHKHKHHDCKGNCPNTSHGNTCGSSSKLAVCPHFHHDHHFPHLGDYGKIPAGAQMICLIMNKNPKDIYITRMLCKF